MDFDNLVGSGIILSILLVGSFDILLFVTLYRRVILFAATTIYFISLYTCSYQVLRVDPIQYFSAIASYAFLKTTSPI